MEKSLNHETISSTEIVDVYLAMIDTAVPNGAKDIADRFNLAIEEAYRLVKHNNIEAMSKRTKTLYEDYRREITNGEYL